MQINKKGLIFDLIGFESVETSKELRLDIIESFADEGDMILFRHYETKLKHLGSDLISESIESDFEGYCMGVYKHRYKETKQQIDSEIKEILYEAATKGNTVHYEETAIAEFKDKLLLDLCSGNLSTLDENVLKKIKEMVFLSYWNEKDKEGE